MSGCALNCVLWNPNGISDTKWNQIKINTLPFTPKIFLFTETHSNNLPKDPNFNLIMNNAPHKGTAIAVHKSVKHKILFKDKDSRFITIEINYNNKPITITVIYFPAKSSQWGKFVEDNITHFNSDIICGDFNFVASPSMCSWPYRQPSHRSNAVRLLDDVLFDYRDIAVDKFSQQNRLYTCKSRFGYSRIDRIYSRLTNCELVNILPFDPNFTNYHAPVLFSIKDNAYNQPRTKSKRFNYSVWSNHRLFNSLVKVIDDVPLDKLSSYVFAVQDEIIQQQQKLLHKTKHLLQKIPKKQKEHMELKSTMNTFFERTSFELNTLNPIKLFQAKSRANAILTSVVQKRCNKKITKILLPDNTVTEDPVIIKAAFVNFYTELYSETEIDKTSLFKQLDNWTPPIIDFKSLSQPFTLEELDNVIKNLSPAKAPGCDGLPGLVYKAFSPGTKMSLLNTLNDFFINEIPLPDEWKKGNIFTIFKKGDKKLIGNRRPISLLRTDYKIYSALITKRLSDLLHLLIGQEQIGFMKGKHIHNNVAVLDTYLRFAKQKHFIMLDFHKAYDSVSHDAIIRALIHLNFPNNFIQAIINMLNGSSANIIINNSTTDYFPIQRGVKQGDPISPLLFNVVIEILNKQSCAINGFKFDDPKIKTLMFADDVVLFGEDMNELHKWTAVLEEFRLATGLTVNKYKSFYFSSSDDDLEDFPRLARDVQFTYLGYCFNSEGLINNSSKLIENSMAPWKMAQANKKLPKYPLLRGTVVQTYMLSKLWYTSCLIDFDSPSNIEHIHQNINNFLWSGRVKMSKKRALVPSNLGGLGLYDLSTRFKAIMVQAYLQLSSASARANQILRKFYNITLPTMKNNYEPSFITIGKTYFKTIEQSEMKFRKKQSLSREELAKTPLSRIYSVLLGIDFEKKENYTPRQKNFLTTH